MDMFIFKELAGMIDKFNKGGSKPAEFNATEAIASQLKRYYDSVEQEPIPNQLLDLLEKLDQAERSGGADGAN